MVWDTIFDYLNGAFDRRMLRNYLIFMSTVFWGLIFCAWLGYPEENKYSIMTHTFSFLGSFETKHSPVWWWLFTVALIFWGLCTFPLARYIHRHFRELSVAGAYTGGAFYFLGAFCIILVGIFPDVKTPITDTLKVTDVHAKVAIAAAVGFILGNFTHGILLLKDRFSGNMSLFEHRPFAILYGLWLALFVTAAYFLIKWEFVYARMKAAAQATGQPIGSSWTEAMNTIYSFPLWENILIYTLFIFLVAKSLILSYCGPAQEG